LDGSAMCLRYQQSPERFPSRGLRLALDSRLGLIMGDFRSCLFLLERLYNRTLFCVTRLTSVPIFSRRSMAGPILTGSNQQPRCHFHGRHAGFIVDMGSQVFSRRLPWHPQAQPPRQLQRPPHPVRLHFCIVHFLIAWFAKTNWRIIHGYPFRSASKIERLEIAGLDSKSAQIIGDFLV
jgi:hypothetical protein